MKLKMIAPAVAIALLSCMNVFADGINMEYDFKDMKLVISGKAQKGESVSIILTNTDDGLPYLINQTDCDDKGEFEFSVSTDVLTDGTYSAEVNTSKEKLTGEKYFSKELLPEKDKGNQGSSGGSGGSGSSGGFGGGFSGSSSVSFAPVVTKPVVEEYVKPSPKGFADVPENHWAHDSIISLAKDGIISGIGDGLFGTEMHLTREQFAKLLIDTMRLDLVEDDIDHTDVDKNSWSYPYLVAIYKYGIMSGYSDTELGVKDNIKRQDLAVLIKEALEVKSVELDTEEKTPIADGESISDYAKESVNYLYRAGIISGMEDGSFMPHDFVTRAQAAVILNKLCTVMGGMGE